MTFLSQNPKDEYHQSQLSHNTPGIRVQPPSATANTPRQNLIYEIATPPCPNYDIATPPCPNYDISTPITTNQNSPLYRDSASVCLPVSESGVEQNNLNADPFLGPDDHPLHLLHASDQPTGNTLAFQTEHDQLGFRHAVPLISPSTTESTAGCTFGPETSSKLLLRSLLHKMEPFPNQLVSACSTDCLIGMPPTRDPTTAPVSIGKKDYSNIRILLVLAGLTFLAGVSFFGIFLLIINLSQTSYAARLLNEAIFTDVRLKMTELPDGRLMYSLNGMLKTESPTVADLELSELQILHVLPNGISVPENNWINPKVLEAKNQYKIPIGTMTTNEIVQIPPSSGVPFKFNTTGYIHVTNPRGLASVVESSLGHKYPIFLLLKGTANLNLLNSLNFTNIPFQKVLIAHHEIANPEASIELEELEFLNGNESMYFKGSAVIRNSGPIEVGKLNPMNFIITHNRRKLGEARVGSFQYTHGENRVTLRGPITIPDNIELRSDLLANAISGTPIVLILAGTEFPTNSTFSKAIIEAELPFTIPRLNLTKTIRLDSLLVANMAPIVPPGFFAEEDTGLHFPETVHSEKENKAATDQRSHPPRANRSLVDQQTSIHRPADHDPVQKPSDPASDATKASPRRNLEVRRRWAENIKETDARIVEQAMAEGRTAVEHPVFAVANSDTSFKWHPRATALPVGFKAEGKVRLFIWHPFVSVNSKNVTVRIPLKAFSSVRHRWEQIGNLNGSITLNQKPIGTYTEEPPMRVGLFDGKFRAFEAFFKVEIRLDNVVQAFPNVAVGADFAKLAGSILINDQQHTIDQEMGPLGLVYPWKGSIRDGIFFDVMNSTLKGGSLKIGLQTKDYLLPFPYKNIFTGPLYWNSRIFGDMEALDVHIGKDGISLVAASADGKSLGGSVINLLLNKLKLDYCINGRPGSSLGERFYDTTEWATLIQGIINRIGNFCLSLNWTLGMLFDGLRA